MKTDKKDIIVINGEIRESNKAFISVKNSGFLYGDGLFETIPIYKGKLYLFDEHVLRLYSSLMFFGYKKISLEIFKSKLKRDVEELIKAKDLNGENANLKIIVSRGAYKKRLDFSSGAKSETIIFADKFDGYNPDYYGKGVDIIISSIKRVPYHNCIYRHKMLNYFENVFAKNEALLKGAFESLFATVEGLMLEGSISNIFMTKEKTVYTPSLDFNILPGITRKKVLDICMENNIKTVECKLSLDDFYNADEIFLTNSLAEIMPVKKIKNFTPREDVPGELTKKILNIYRNYYKN